METIGWVGSILLAVCGLPQMIDSIIKGKTEGVSIVFLWSWLIGEILTLSYIVGQTNLSFQLVVNYSLNIVFIFVILYYFYFPKKVNI